MLRSARTLVVAFAATLLALGSLSVAPPAWAHTAFASSDPADGAEIASPETVTVEFSGTLLELGSLLALVQADTRVELEPVVSGATVSADVPDALAAGQWTLVYRVVAEDGHPLEGEIGFTVVGEPEPSAAPSDTASAEPSAIPSEEASEGATSSPTPSQGAADPAAGLGDGPRLAILIGAALALLGTLAAVIVNQRRRGGPPPEDEGHGPRADTSGDD